MFNLIPHDQHYVNRYIKFIQSIRSKEPRVIEYSEKHHILPKCFSGTNKKENLINLTYREHFIAHLILTKCFFDKNKAKMVYAFNMMMKFKTKNHNRNEIFSKYYEEKRKEWFKAKCSGENNPMFGKSGPMLGKHHSEESKQKMSKSQKISNWQSRIPIGEHFNIGRKHTEETKEKLKYAKSISKYKRPTGNENPLFGIIRNDEIRNKISAACKQKPKIHCEHCSRNFDPGNFKLHHGEKCKSKILLDYQPQM